MCLRIAAVTIALVDIRTVMYGKRLKITIRTVRIITWFQGISYCWRRVCITSVSITSVSLWYYCKVVDLTSWWYRYRCRYVSICYCFRHSVSHLITEISHQSCYHSCHSYTFNQSFVHSKSPPLYRSLALPYILVPPANLYTYRFLVLFPSY